MTRIADEWLRDMPAQFSGRHNIEVIVEAFSRQIEELQGVFDSLNLVTDLETASGIGLDLVGSILCLTRTEAMALLKIGEAAEMDDETYRFALRLKKLMNNSECTYYDIADFVRRCFPSVPFTYQETVDDCASISLTFENADSEWGKITRLLKGMKPAGVRMILKIVSNTTAETQSYALVKAFGVTIEESCDTSTSASNHYGDFSSYHNVDLEQYTHFQLRMGVD